MTPIADRPIQITDRNNISLLIRQGTFDAQLDRIEAAVRARRTQRKIDVDTLVREVYGPGAEIVTGRP